MGAVASRGLVRVAVVIAVLAAVIGAGSPVGAATPTMAGGQPDAAVSIRPGDAPQVGASGVDDEATLSAAGATTAPATYWLATADGAVFSVGAAQFHGSAAGAGLRAPTVALVTTPTKVGYWLTTADGGVFTFGDAAFVGSAGDLALNRPIVGMAATPSGQGYWLVSSDGGVFSFGDATFYGSTGGLALNQPIVGVAATPSGQGYWLVASDGGIFAFGDAAFYGSTGSIRLNRPVVGMAATPSGGGYWLVASDGGIFSFGVAPFYGSTGGIALNRPVVAMAASPSGGGYWMVASEGGIFAFGDAGYRGSLAGRALSSPVVAIAPTVSANPFTPGTTGYDISWPQCGGAYPDPPYDVAVVGVNGGNPFEPNPCLASQAVWGSAASARTLYMNINSPEINQPEQGDHGPAGACGAEDGWCRAYNYGWNAGIYAYATAASQGVYSNLWWLDVELPGTLWSDDQAANARVVQGAVDALNSQGVLAGIYSTPYQWNLITGSYRFASVLPLWQAGAYYPSTGELRTSYCSLSFAGGETWLIQGATFVYDTNYAC